MGGQFFVSFYLVFSFLWPTFFDFRFSIFLLLLFSFLSTAIAPPSLNRKRLIPNRRRRTLRFRRYMYNRSHYSRLSAFAIAQGDYWFATSNKRCNVPCILAVEDDDTANTQPSRSLILNVVSRRLASAAPCPLRIFFGHGCLCTDILLLLSLLSLLFDVLSFSNYRSSLWFTFVHPFLPPFMRQPDHFLTKPRRTR